ncbi:MAG: carboxypeptidase regulatory-like domain-containing protein [Nevskiaceae bacterium]|nr:MAG: carboxypeptidase regulatory-like domain-containing protein [Nevskiaceae bacterium]
MSGNTFHPRGGHWLSLALAGVLLLASCARSSSSGGAGSGAGPGPGPAAAGAIQVLSNRADLISGGDALLQVTLPAGVAAKDVTVDLNGQDVTKQFATGADGRYIGLVSGMPPGSNRVTAHFPGGASSSYTLINHPQEGPVFSGPQLQPWTCQQGATDAGCNQPPSYSYVYKSTDPTKSALQPYDPANPPTDVASTTTDNGTTVPFIVRIETGYQDRDQYKIAALFQPGKPWTAVAPQPQFNHKLLITHGVSCGVDHNTGNAPSVTSFNPADVTGAGLPAVGADSVQYALGQGFIIMSTALDYSGHNCNLPLQAESLMMAKEHLIEQYGTLRYTIGTGCSGGSLAQQWIANAYPGIYQGILPTCSFPDAWGTATQFADYHLTLAYFTNPSKWGSGVVWSPTQMADVQGHLTIVNSEVSDNAQFHVAVPTDACSGVPAPQPNDPATRYDPATNPGGVRCDIQDAAINVFGPRPMAIWTDNEKKIGRGYAGFPVDNVGVQYGLAVLQAGTITAAQFLDLNQKIGGLDVDTNPIPERTPAVEPALANAYRSGMINETNNLDRTAIIDCRGPDPGAFHDSYRAFAVRARLDREHGNHDNQMIWEGPAPIVGDAACAYNSLIAMDRWLAAVEKDTSGKTLAQKIAADKPSDIGDQCYDGVGNKLTDGLCPGTNSPVPGSAALSVGVVPVYATPRMVAGDAITTDANKCQLKPLNRNDNYGPLGASTFTDAQWAQMQALFPTGVCDFSKPGVSQQGTVAWQTYQDPAGNVIYGGTALPAPPANSGGGWASPAFATTP